MAREVSERRPLRDAAHNDQAAAKQAGVGPSVTDLHRFGQPSGYSLTAPELARHVRQLRRAGWLRWELRVRFGRWAA